ncbi:MAG: ribonuclease PH [Dehalococcoidia bacterium]|nr:ribonuclease PH [Dehalococcoidia bacterium]
MARIDGRRNDQIRPVRITPGFLAFADGSALIELGETKVLCAVTVQDSVPPFLRGKGSGWITAEYSMLPRSTNTRTPRESVTGRIGGRTHEIQRLVGRSLRAVANLAHLGERTLMVDCDVIQADGGTRTAAITGSYIALSQAIHTMIGKKQIVVSPLQSAVAAISLGVVDGEELLDLCYAEDSRAEADFNVVMTGRGTFVELQGTAEMNPFSRDTVDSLMVLAETGIKELLQVQEKVLQSLGI